MCKDLEDYDIEDLIPDGCIFWSKGCGNSPECEDCDSYDEENDGR